MADWLRPAFTRARTPILNAPATFDSRTREPSSADETTHEDTDLLTPRLRPSSRVSSYIGFRPSSPVALRIATPDDFQNARNPQNLYHKPSGDQMAETLKVVMMTRYTIDPIPVEYNACILHVLEAYQVLREKVDGSEAVLEKVKEEHRRDVEEFERMSLGWETKERDYKAEIKNLEVLLAYTDGGMEKVVLARSRSKVYGLARVSDEIRRSFGTIKERHKIRSREHEFDRQNEDQYQYQGAVPQFPPQSTEIKTSGVSRSQLEELDRQHMEKQQQEEHRRAMLSFESSPGIDSGSEPMARSQDLIMRENPIRESTIGLGIIVEEKPLPPTPGSPGEDISTLRHSKEKIPDKFILEDSRPSLDRELSFSFQKGDDASMVPGDDKTSKIKRQMLEDLVRHRKFAGSSHQVDESDTLDVNLALNNPRHRGEPSPKSTPLPTLAQFDSMRPGVRPRSGGNSPSLQIFDPPSRNNSTASVITAIRDNSGRSSVTSSSESHNGRLRLDQRSGGASEAVTAAARAYAASNNKRGNGGSGGSSANGRNRSSTDERDTRDELRMKDRKEKGTPKINVSRDKDREKARTN